MRTTVSIDDDVLDAVKERARRENRTVGQVLSDLARRELQRVSPTPATTTRNGFPVLAPRGEPVTNSVIDSLREEDGL